MRISDWSSDVCSSDLEDAVHRVARQHHRDMRILECRRFGIVDHRLHLRLGFGHALDEGVGEELGVHLVPRRHPLEGAGPRLEQRVRASGDGGGRRGGGRSEEHTSELQLLMRITYAVFCLTKKFLLSCSHDYIMVYSFLSYL